MNSIYYDYAIDKQLAADEQRLEQQEAERTGHTHIWTDLDNVQVCSGCEQLRFKD